MNRLVPTGHRAGDPLERHWCDGAESPVAKETTILPARAGSA
jgi:hypothetical protein